VGTIQQMRMILPAYAEEVLETAQKDLAVTDCQRCIALLTQLMPRHALKLPARLDEVHLPIAVDHEGQSLHRNRRSVMASKLLLPENLTARRFIAVNRPASVNADQKIARNDHGGDNQVYRNVDPMLRQAINLLPVLDWLCRAVDSIHVPENRHETPAMQVF
jgi:hypothetical protein